MSLSSNNPRTLSSHKPFPPTGRPRSPQSAPWHECHNRLASPPPPASHSGPSPCCFYVHGNMRQKEGKFPPIPAPAQAASEMTRGADELPRKAKGRSTESGDRCGGGDVSGTKPSAARRQPAPQARGGEFKSGSFAVPSAPPLPSPPLSPPLLCPVPPHPPHAMPPGFQRHPPPHTPTTPHALRGYPRHPGHLGASPIPLPPHHHHGGGWGLPPPPRHPPPGPTHLHPHPPPVSPGFGGGGAYWARGPPCPHPTEMTARPPPPGLPRPRPHPRAASTTPSPPLPMARLSGPAPAAVAEGHRGENFVDGESSTAPPAVVRVLSRRPCDGDEGGEEERVFGRLRRWDALARERDVAEVEKRSASSSSEVDGTVYVTSLQQVDVAVREGKGVSAASALETERASSRPTSGSPPQHEFRTFPQSLEDHRAQMALVRDVKDALDMLNNASTARREESRRDEASNGGEEQKKRKVKRESFSCGETGTAMEGVEKKHVVHGTAAAASAMATDASAAAIGTRKPEKSGIDPMRSMECCGPTKLDEVRDLVSGIVQIASPKAGKVRESGRPSVDVLRRVLSSHPSDGPVQEFCNAELFDMVLRDPRCARQNMVRCAPLLRAVVKGMEANSEDDDVQERACRTLQMLSVEDRHRSLVVASGACAAVLSALSSRGTKSEAVAAAALGAIKLLSAHSEGRVALAGRDECATTLTIKAMEAHPDAAVVQAEGCSVLSNLAMDKTQKRVAVLTTKEMASIIAAMRTHPRSELVQRQACVALKNLSQQYVNLAQMVKCAGGGSGSTTTPESLLRLAIDTFPAQCQNQGLIVLQRLEHFRSWPLSITSTASIVGSNSRRKTNKRNGSGSSVRLGRNESSREWKDDIASHPAHYDCTSNDESEHSYVTDGSAKAPVLFPHRLVTSDGRCRRCRFKRGHAAICPLSPNYQSCIYSNSSEGDSGFDVNGRAVSPSRLVTCDSRCRRCVEGPWFTKGHACTCPRSAHNQNPFQINSSDDSSDFDVDGKADSQGIVGESKVRQSGKATAETKASSRVCSGDSPIKPGKRKRGRPCKTKTRDGESVKIAPRATAEKMGSGSKTASSKSGGSVSCKNEGPISATTVGGSRKSSRGATVVTAESEASERKDTAVTAIDLTLEDNKDDQRCKSVDGGGGDDFSAAELWQSITSRKKNRAQGASPLDDDDEIGVGSALSSRRHGDLASANAAQRRGWCPLRSMPDAHRGQRRRRARPPVFANKKAASMPTPKANKTARGKEVFALSDRKIDEACAKRGRPRLQKRRQSQSKKRSWRDRQPAEGLGIDGGLNPAIAALSGKIVAENPLGIGGDDDSSPRETSQHDGPGLYTAKEVMDLTWDDDGDDVEIISPASGCTHDSSNDSEDESAILNKTEEKQWQNSRSPERTKVDPMQKTSNQRNEVGKCFEGGRRSNKDSNHTKSTQESREREKKSRIAQKENGGACSGTNDVIEIEDDEETKEKYAKIVEEPKATSAVPRAKVPSAHSTSKTNTATASATAPAPPKRPQFRPFHPVGKAKKSKPNPKSRPQRSHLVASTGSDASAEKSKKSLPGESSADCSTGPAAAATNTASSLQSPTTRMQQENAPQPSASAGGSKVLHEARSAETKVASQHRATKTCQRSSQEQNNCQAERRPRPNDAMFGKADEQERLFREAARRVRTEFQNDPGAMPRFRVVSGEGGTMATAIRGPSFERPVEDVSSLPGEHWKWTDPFARLGLPPSCGPGMVKRNFRRMALLYHPDKVRAGTGAEGVEVAGNGNMVHARFHAIKDAYEVLSRGC